MKTKIQKKSKTTKSKTFGIKSIINMIATRYELGKGTANCIVRDIVASLFQTTIEDGRLRLPNGYGILKVKTSKARVARNPQTGESVNVPAKTKVTFRQGKTLKWILS